MTSRQLTRRIRSATDCLLTGLIVGLLGGMALLAVAQILLRNVFSYSLYWGDELLQLLLLWLVMAGAVAAARNGEHLRINLLSQHCPRRIRPWMYAGLNAFTTAVCASLTWQGVKLVRDAARYGDTMFVDVPAWAGQAIIPIGFAFLAAHYGARLMKDLYHGFHRGVPTGPGT